MSRDIRRMNREELDALNEHGRLWRDRNKLASDSAAEQADQESNNITSATSIGSEVGEQLELL